MRDGGTRGEERGGPVERAEEIREGTTEAEGGKRRDAGGEGA